MLNTILRFLTVLVYIFTLQSCKTSSESRLSELPNSVTDEDLDLNHVRKKAFCVDLSDKIIGIQIDKTKPSGPNSLQNSYIRIKSESKIDGEIISFYSNNGRRIGYSYQCHKEGDIFQASNLSSLYENCSISVYFSWVECNCNSQGCKMQEIEID